MYHSGLRGRLFSLVLKSAGFPGNTGAVVATTRQTIPLRLKSSFCRPPLAGLSVKRFPQAIIGSPLRAFPNWMRTRPVHTVQSDRPARLKYGDSALEVNIKGTQKTLNYIWLREHCRCGECFNHKTHQKNIHSHRIPVDIKPVDVQIADGEMRIQWPDDHKTTYSLDWLMDNSYPPRKHQKVHKYLWDQDSLCIEDVPRVYFSAFMEEEETLKEMLHTLLKYGFALVDEVPLSVEGTQMACERISFIQNTLYGAMYDFTSDFARSDTAYTRLHIGAHNDTTYFSLPAGLQVLHCLHHDGEGGESLVLDGFNAAEKLKQINPQSFELLATVPVPHEYMERGENSHHLLSCDTILKTDRVTGELLWVRYNHLDRAPLNTIPPQYLPRFYQALSELSTIIEHPQQELWFKLKPGTTLFVDNFRALHGRAAFTGNRRVCGCYLPRDDWIGKARTLGLI